jgi:hypothetical protein
MDEIEKESQTPSVGRAPSPSPSSQGDESETVRAHLDRNAPTGKRPWTRRSRLSAQLCLSGLGWAVPGKENLPRQAQELTRDHRPFTANRDDRSSSQKTAPLRASRRHP